MKYLVTGGAMSYLEGHCPHCDYYIHVPIVNLENDDLDNYPLGFDFGSIKSVDAKCHRCLRKFIAVNDGFCRKTTTSTVAAPPRRAPISSTFTCPHCGMQRPSGAQYCPYCRLDSSGRVAGSGYYG